MLGIAVVVVAVMISVLLVVREPNAALGVDGWMVVIHHWLAEPEEGNDPRH